MIFLIYPHQLFRNISLLKGKKVLLIEEPLFFTQYRFHIQKLVMHRASMKFYEEYLQSHAIEVAYFEDDSYLECYKDQEIEVYDVADFYLQKKIEKNFANLHFLANPNFLNVSDTAKFFHSYYINRRKELGVLLDENNKPLGGKWSFDAQNRKKLPKDLKTPSDLCFDNRYIQEAKTYCKKFESFGECEDFYYPITYTEAKMVFAHFLEQKFSHFGEYQDAIEKEGIFLFHSNISSALNIGLLDLHYVIDQVLTYPDVPMNAKEGFIRQIIGWREFMFSIYKQDGVRMRNSNFFGAYNSLPKRFLEGKTGIVPLDDVIKKVHKTSYAHHIERLMILGNIFTLLEIDPNEVHDFFMAGFIDAYDWVMVGNVYGMSLYADGGSITTKPYCASSNYMLKMSNYKKGEWCEVVDALYWSFLDKHSDKFASNPRMKMQLSLLEKMDQEKLSKHKKIAYEFKKKLGMYDHKEQSIERLIEMAWQDRTPFDVIQEQFGYTENQVKKMMRTLMKKSSFKMWRKRVQGRKTKHMKKLDHKPQRFQGPW
ncbi:MAG: TIGR03643 family protein [Campylobacterales bacterium]|nr:TIGR03643 family protein [Campylobacterales bacterium]